MADSLDPGMIESGNIDLTNRPRVKNPDGSTSTVRSMSANIGGNEVLLPTISDDGRNLSQEEAIQQYRTTGKHLGKFKDPDSATSYAKKLHEQQAQQLDQDVPMLGDYNKLTPPTPTPTEMEEYYKNNPPVDHIPNEDGDGNDGKAHRKLNFDSSSAEPSNFERLKGLVGSLGQRFSDNLAKSNQVISDSTDTMLDRIKMQNPNQSGPRLPDSPMPAELAESQMMANGVAGSVAPIAKFARLAGLVGKAAPALEKGAADAMYEAAQTGQAPLSDAIRAQQALSRSVDFEQRLASQKMAARAAALAKLRGQ
jgi:hypothetical protein